MRHNVTHALVSEQGVSFAVIAVRDHVANTPMQAASFISKIAQCYDGLPVVVIGENNGRTFGRQDIVRFLQGVNPRQLPWRRGWIDVPDARFASPAPAAGATVVEWIGGLTDTAYRYTVLLIGAPMPNVLGNYIVTRKAGAKWVPIYIGEGILSSRVSTSHHKRECWSSKGATHVHLHENVKDEPRKFEEEDLITGYPEVLIPIGCNEKVGG